MQGCGDQVWLSGTHLWETVPKKDTWETPSYLSRPIFTETLALASARNVVLGVLCSTLLLSFSSSLLLFFSPPSPHLGLGKDSAVELLSSALGFLRQELAV